MPLARWLRRGLLAGTLSLGVPAAVSLGPLCLPALAHAAPVEWLPTQSPFYDELQVVRTEGLLDTTASIEARPMSRVEVATLVAFALTHHPDQAATNAGLVRLHREFSRELVQMGFEPAPTYTPPLIEVRGERREGFRAIPYLEAALEQNTAGVGRLADHSRFGGRFGVEFGNVLLYTDLFAGRIDGGRHFADPLVQNTDFIVYTEDTYLSAHTPWIDLSLGRTRSGWGPGHEGTLLWSPTAPPVTSLLWDASLFGGHVRGSALHADINASKGERVAAHRLDFQVSPRLHFGVSETARYHSTNWDPLYVVSVIPFTIVQRMQQQDGGDSTVRNNIMVAGDVRWRAARAATLYGEVLFDDLTFTKSGTPVRMGYQAGWLGAGTAFGRRVSWLAEYSRVYRYVYAVFYGENYIHQGQAIGYPEGPDSRSLVARGALDWNASWRVTAGGGQLDHGEGFLGEYFDPNGPPAQGSVLSGVVERTRFGELGAQWTPKDGVQANLLWGYQWQHNADHVAGLNREAWYGRIGVSLRH
jgi:hypothetical protein